MESLTQPRREQLRWDILQALYVGRPYPVTERTLFRTVGELYNCTRLELRQELDYVCDRKLAELRDAHREDWNAVITRLGVDVCEYTEDVKPGIARPPKRL